MNIFLKDNDLKILRYIIYNNNCTIKKITEFINLSDVYVRQSIKKINTYLKLNYNFEIIKTGKYFQFPSDKKYIFFEDFSQNLTTSYLSTKKIRIDYILMNLIFQNKVKITEIAKIFNVTRLTISNDLKEVKAILKTYDLILESKQWEGISLNSNSDRFCFFSIEYITKILFEQSLTLDINNQYSNITNPNLFEYFNCFVDLKTQKNMIFFLKTLVKTLNLNSDIFSFQSFYAALIFSHIHNTYKLPSNFYNKRKRLKKDVDKYFYIFKNFENFDLVNKLNLEFLAILLVGNTVNALKTHKFFHPYIFDIILKLENLFKINFSDEDKLTLKNMLKTYLFKKKYELLHFSLPTKSLSNDDLNFISKVDFLINKEKNAIYYNDIITFSFFLKTLKRKYMYQYGKEKNILLVDSSYNLWVSENLKSFITLNYGVKNITLINIFQNINWEITVPKYDAVFFINLKKPTNIASFSTCYEISYFGNNHFFLEEYINFGGKI
ncbi:HTH domain-containing protein [Cetobacterium somerae]|uniref:helix-turn-helix domain-containing protein n=1 Tax=Cetobacterium sp. NK01 TaxID=2993530 RepID=UPI002116C749|nr:HTH domain-containing protein [Cetobacterium sp. NK01]MCQ8211238.1 HTH domain-containing protein [Cetobacterium sp. NK01]